MSISPFPQKVRGRIKYAATRAEDLFRAKSPAVSRRIISIRKESRGGQAGMHEIVRRLSDSRNLWQVKIFGLYLFSILIFAAVYYLLYQRRRQNFLFNAEMLTHQKGIVLADLKLRSRNLEIEGRLLNEARDYLQGAGISQLGYEVEISIALKSGRIALIQTGVPLSEPTLKDDPVDSVTTIMTYASDDTKIRSRKIGHFGAADPSRLVAIALELVADERRSIKERLGRVTTDTPDVWSFWDFVYFSTITQTTVGYGDILPNSTSVRKVVCLQIILGYALLAVVLNLVFASR